MVHASVIGCGNMGGALVRGLSQADRHQVTACDADEDALTTVAAYSTETTTDTAVAGEAEVVFLAVKPDTVGDVLAELDLESDQTLVSVAAGISIEFLESKTNASVHRMMPNLAAEYGEMAGAVAPEPTPAVSELLADLGTVVTIEEDQMDLATAINGSGPAFVFYLIKAFQQAGVDGGLDPEKSAQLSAQTFKGASETVLQGDESVDDLIDAVCSPNGTTIEGMEVLWDSDVEDVLGETIAAAERRSAEITSEVGHE